MTNSMFSRRQFRTPYLRSRPPKRHLNVRRSTLRIEGLEDRTTPAAVTFVNDNWHLLLDADNSLSVSVGDMVINNNDTINPGTITATYGITGFGTVTTGAFTGSVPGADTINNAITNTDLLGTVNVLEGTYTALATVNKTITVVGAQAGVDARTGRSGAAESVINGGGFNLTASDVVIDGFVVQNSTAAFPGFGIILGAGTSGSQVLNSIIQNNIAGISLANTGANQAQIQFNLIRNNNQPGPVSGHGIYTDQFNAGGTLANVLIDSNSFVGNSGQGIGFSSTDPTKPATQITISNNVFDGNGRGLYAFSLTNSSITDNTFQNSTDAATADLRLFEGVSGLTISGNVLQNGAGRAVRINNGGTPGLPNATNVVFALNSVTGYADPAGVFQVDAGGYTGPLDATGNWWGSINGPTITTNPGGTGQTLSDPDAVVDFQPWLVYLPDSDPTVAGIQFVTSFSVPAQTAGFTTTNNNYRRLVNVVDLLQDGQTVSLSGTFNWTEANAAAAWALGNDGVVSVVDDFTLLVRPDLHGITFTAAALGSARIQGPGDLATANLEGFLLFDGGDNQNWTISNLEIFDLDLGLAFFNGAGGIDAFNNLKILNNHIRIPNDLNTTVAPADVNQNIGIHFSFGENQTIQGNQIDIPGNGVSSGPNLSLIVGMQSNTSAGDAYDGLLIDGNTLRVINAQSASPSRIVGIWENGHAHFNNITISNNQFLNLAPGNNPALNIQRAFRVTSHSSFTSTVTYSRNTVQGANIGFEWLAGQNFAGHEPVQLIENSVTKGETGVKIQSDGSADLFNNDLSGNTGLAINNLTGGFVNAGGNWFGTNTAAGVLAEVSANVDFSPWLDTGTDTSAAPGFQGDFSVLHVSAASPQVGFVGQMQEGIDLATSGGTVIAEAGNYFENLVIDKSLSLQGAGNTTILNTAGGVGIDISAAGGDVTIQDLAINGADTAIEASDLNSLTLSNVGIAGSTTGGSITNVSTVNVITDATATNQTVQIDAAQFVIDGKTFTYSGVGTLSIATGAGDDTFTVPSIGVNALHLDGGANTAVGDTLITTPHILATSEIVNFENLPGIIPPVFVDSGNLVIVGTSNSDKIDVTIRNNTDVVVKLNGVEVLVTPLATITGRIKVHALGGDDLVKLASNVPVGAELRGGPGNDKLIGGQGTDLLDGGLGIDTVQGGRGNDILVGSTDPDVLAGQGDFDTLLGPAGDTTWAITGAGAGRISDQAQFNTVELLVGGAGNDVFSFRGNGSVKGRIDGGAGVNKLDYSRIGGLTVINLSIGTATRTGGVSNIRDVDGGNGPSVIVGDSQKNVLRGFGGRDLLIGGGGVDVLAGGDGDDILIGGTTAYDASNTALTSLMNEWKGTAKYDIRVDRLMRIRAGGLNAGNHLTTTTVFSDGVANILDGQAGQDWFFANSVDVAVADAGERVVNL